MVTLEIVIMRGVVQGWYTGTVTLCKVPERFWARNISEFHFPLPSISIIYFFSLFKKKKIPPVSECGAPLSSAEVVGHNCKFFRLYNP